MIKGAIMEARRVAVLGASVRRFLVGRHRRVLHLGDRRRGSLGCGKAGLVGKLTELAVLDSVGRVGVIEVVGLEPEPVNVDLECGGENDLNDLQWSADDTVLPNERDSP